MKIKVKAVKSDTSRPMKDSGVEWIGLVPEKWGVYPARYAFSEEKTKNSKGTIKHALKFYNGTIIPKESFDADLDEYVAETITSYTVVKPNTIMINGLNLNYDLKSLRVGLVNELGVITSAYLALIPDESYILPTYATYLFKGYESKMAFHNMGSGIRKTLGFKEFKHQPILIPPLEEQYSISDYLDKECARIDSVIGKTRESIEEYKKLIQSIITEAVTKGIRPNRVMKDSGISWIGAIPIEWEMTKLGYECEDMIVPMRDKPPFVVDDSAVPWCRIEDVDGKYLNGTKSNRYVEAVVASQMNLKEMPIHTVLSACSASVGAVAITTVPCYTNQTFIGLVAGKALNYEFLYYYLSMIKPVLKSIGMGTTIVYLSRQTYTKLPLILPPMIEQKEMVAYLNKKCDAIDMIVQTKTNLIDSLEALKKAIIYEYVTGKKEVS